MKQYNTYEECKRAKCFMMRCFANNCGDCTILVETPVECNKCKFFKTETQAKKDAEQADVRLLKEYGLTSRQIRTKGYTYRDLLAIKSYKDD